MDQMRQYESTKYQKACIVIAGDAMEDWKYLFRELKMRVGVSVVPSVDRRSPKIIHSTIDTYFRDSLVALRLSNFFFSELFQRSYVTIPSTWQQETKARSVLMCSTQYKQARFEDHTSAFSLSLSIRRSEETFDGDTGRACDLPEAKMQNSTRKMQFSGWNVRFLRIYDFRYEK